MASPHGPSTSSLADKDECPIPNRLSQLVASGDGVSLSVNYLPSKFSTGLLAPVPRRRKGRAGLVLPKQGGGREAFKSSEPRMPAEGDEDYDGVAGGLFNKEGGHTRPRLRWNKFKWALFVANSLLSAWSLPGLVVCLLTWFDVFQFADIIRFGNRIELIMSTAAAGLAFFTAIIGWAGILLNNRSFLAVYTFLLWVCFALLITPGYITYKERTFDLEGKLNAQWSRTLEPLGRLHIQDRLHCCGYYSPYVEATVSQTCYSRTVLPGCKAVYLAFERRFLKLWYTIVFSLAPLQLAIMVTGLLCSNHVTYRFGKGMMPKAYRLSTESTAIIMDSYASQLAEQYGSTFVSDVLSRPYFSLNQDSVPSTPVKSDFSVGGSSVVRRSPPGIRS